MMDWSNPFLHRLCNVTKYKLGLRLDCKLIVDQAVCERLYLNSIADVSETAYKGLVLVRSGVPEVL